ncbi:type II toxin-antitoxin system VapC family toxin [Candidatus Binatus sp.]|jgi:predicted nucleic acid-binding protein|uniref:type II toxin-antitoxin system VapC family toxin n=2 Tax=Candidatus Binatus sp. TaxID=2811406 RepID=UPI003BCCD694
MPTVLVDAGPLVALIDRSDPYHQRCVSALATVREPLGTVWPAFTEAMYLLRGDAQDQRALWNMINVGGVRFVEIGHEDCPRMRELMWKYRDLPMDLADAALVRVAEREGLRRVFTIDRQDFEIYRPHRLGRFEILP